MTYSDQVKQDLANGILNNFLSAEAEDALWQDLVKLSCKATLEVLQPGELADGVAWILAGKLVDILRGSTNRGDGVEGKVGSSESEPSKVSDSKAAHSPTYSKDANGNEYWYDANGNLTHYRDSTGYEDWKEYDAKGNCIHCRNSNGFEYWKEYDANGNCTHYRGSTGYEEWYDAKGNLTHCRDSNGSEEWYDAKGNLIRRKKADGTIINFN